MSSQKMGKILTTLTITNRADQSAAKRGYIPTEQVRSLTLHNILVDSGATTLCLPADAITLEFSKSAIALPKPPISRIAIAKIANRKFEPRYATT